MRFFQLHYRPAGLILLRSVVLARQGLKRVRIYSQTLRAVYGERLRRIRVPRTIHITSLSPAANDSQERYISLRSAFKESYSDLSDSAAA